MKKGCLLIFAIFNLALLQAQMLHSITLQYIPRINEQSISGIYRSSESLGVHLNIGFVNGYSFFYSRTNDSSLRLLQSKGSGIAVRIAPRLIKPIKNSKTEFYFEPLLVFKHYTFKDTAYSKDLNYSDTAYFNLYNRFPNQNIGLTKYTRTGIQLGFLAGWQFYFAKNFTASINGGASLRKQFYSSGYSNFGMSLHLNFGIGYVIRSKESHNTKS